jgi:hypothetical protein
MGELARRRGFDSPPFSRTRRVGKFGGESGIFGAKIAGLREKQDFLKDLRGATYSG